MGDCDGDGHGAGGMVVADPYGDGVSAGTTNGNGWGAGIRCSAIEDLARYLLIRQEGSGWDPDD